MSQRVTTYIKIDKYFLLEAPAFVFDCYTPLPGATQVERLFCKGAALGVQERHRIEALESLYIRKEDELLYEEHYSRYLSALFTDASLPLPLRSLAVYKKAVMLIERLFDDPKNSAMPRLCKEAVSALAYTIMDKEFTVNSMMEVIAHDYYTHTHCVNVCIYSMSLGRFLGLEEHKLMRLGEAALLHDIGKCDVAREIIRKSGKLSTREYEAVKKHPESSYRIALDNGMKDQEILEGIRHHHERMDGSGYPDRISGDKIPLFARIIAVADIFDALTTKRSYKEAMSSFKAFKLIKEQMSHHVDMQLLNAMIRMLKRA